MTVYQRLSYYATVFVLTVIFSFNQKINADVNTGHCVWYGECQDDAPRGKLNCVYNGPAKPLTDPKALSVLQQYCPQLYAGNSSLTCCSPTQLITMEQNLVLPWQLLHSCPSCLYNFLNIFCSLTCDPHQSTFVGVKTKGHNDKGVPTVLSVDYAMTTTFANGMYNSCKDVLMPSANEPAISVLCGHNAVYCTAKKLLDYIGSPSNGHTPFGIDFHVQDMPWSNPGQYTLDPMNTTAVPCYETVGNSSACSYQDCPAISPPLTPTLPNISVLYPWPKYRIEQLVVTRPANNTRVEHTCMPPAPSTALIYFSSLFDKAFLNLLLELQSKIQGITANYDGKTITLDDVCYHGKTNWSCVIVSILEYWQSNKTRIHEEIWDEYGFFEIADYLDHLVACHHTPNATNDHTAFNSTCLSTSGMPVDPWLVMRDGNGFTESRTFVISFIVRNSNKAESRAAEAWEKAYTNFLTNFSSPNMTIKFSTKINADVNTGHCVWYGECQDDAPRGKLNCVYNGPAKPLTDPKALSVLQQYCPQLYAGANAQLMAKGEALSRETLGSRKLVRKLRKDKIPYLVASYDHAMGTAGNSSLTCCSPTQLITMEQNLVLPWQQLHSCPSCLYNFLNIFCSLTCDPHQSTFVGVKTKGHNDKGVPTVLSVDYAMTTTFANGMYNSCKDVLMPSANEPAISVLCGRNAADCTAKKLLNYIGSPSNGHTPFGIDFHVQDMPWSNPGQYTLDPMNTTAVPCYETVGNSSACSYQDCPALSPPLTPTLPNISVLYPWPKYRIEQLVVSRPANNTRVKHMLPAPSTAFIYFSSLFDKAFLNLLLELQSKIQGITANYNGKTITLDDVCYHGKTNGSCVIVSILEYWQNNKTRIDEEIWDEYGFFEIADYLDHLMACHHTPNATNDHTAFNSTCLSTSGMPVDPWLVMRDGNGFTESRTFVISFIVRNSNTAETRAAEAWEKAYTNFLTDFSSPNMTIKFSTKKPITSITFPNPVASIDLPFIKDPSSATVPNFSATALLTFAICSLIFRKL